MVCCVFVCKSFFVWNIFFLIKNCVCSSKSTSTAAHSTKDGKKSSLEIFICSLKPNNHLGSWFNLCTPISSAQNPIFDGFYFAFGFIPFFIMMKKNVFILLRTETIIIKFALGNETLKIRIKSFFILLLFLIEWSSHSKFEFQTKLQNDERRKK